MSMFHELMMKKKGIPSRYQEVEYIESTGTQYIDTGYVPTVDDVIDTDLQKVSQLWAEDFFFGIANADSSKGGLWIEQSSNNKWYIRFASTSSSSPDSTGTDRENKIHITLKKESFVSSGGTTATPSFAGTMNSTSLVLFGRFNSTQTTVITSAIRIWNFQITRNGTLIRNFIPVYDTLTQKYGIWESVEGKFYGNDGTGDFKGSIVGYTIVGSPTITDGVVSGVNTTNGIFTASSIPSFQTFEFVAKVGSVWNSSGSYLPVCAFNDSSVGYKYISAVNSTKRLSFVLANNDTDKVGIENFPYATALTSSGVYIRLLAQKNTNDWTYTIAYSTDKQTWTQGQLISAVSIEGKPICFIKNLSGTTGGDTWIDMKETSIKINNKLWFNGQQA